MCVAIARAIVEPGGKSAKTLLVKYLLKHVFNCCRSSTPKRLDWYSAN
jgi:hypothetical protein